MSPLQFAHARNTAHHVAGPRGPGLPRPRGLHPVGARRGDPDAESRTDDRRPTETPVAWHEPESRYGLECDALVDDALAADTFSVAVSEVDPLVTASGVGIAIPRNTSILSQGGTVCEWSNGVAMNTQYGYVPDYVGVAVSVTPRPDAGWSAQATSKGMPGEVYGCAANLCTMSTTAGDAWVTLEASGGDGAALDPAAADALFAAVVAEVVAAGAPEPAVTPARDVPPLPTDCEAVLPLATVRSISGVASAEPRGGGGGGWSDWAEARLQAGNEGCDWGVGDFETAAAVNWVRDGRWAYDRAVDAGTFTPATIAGLGVDDLASVRCDPGLRAELRGRPRARTRLADRLRRRRADRDRVRRGGRRAARAVSDTARIGLYHLDATRLPVEPELRRLHHVREQHGPGHRPDAARVRREVPGDRRRRPGRRRP